MTAKNGLKFETFVDQFPRKLEKALPGFRIIRSQGDELEYEYEGFDNALDLKIVYEKFQQTRADIATLVGRYADYVRQFAFSSRQPQPVQAAAVKHYDGYSEKEADWFQKAAQEQRAKLKTYAPPPPPPPVSAPSNKHPNVIKVKPRRPLPPFRPAPAAAPVVSPIVLKPAPVSPARKSSAKSAKKTSRSSGAVKAKPKPASKSRSASKSRPASAKRAGKAAPARTKAASTARHTAQKKAAKPRFMDRVKKIFGRR